VRAPFAVHGGLTPGPVERDHQLSAQSLAQRLLADEHLQLRNQLVRASECEIGVDARLQRREPRLLEARDLALREVVVAELRKCGPTPKRERLAKRLCGGCPVPIFELSHTVRGEALEPRDVGLVPVERYGVAARLGDDDV
jgi:hypothetical protein